jgi:hypothetical protein
MDIYGLILFYFVVPQIKKYLKELLCKCLLNLLIFLSVASAIKKSV